METTVVEDHELKKFFDEELKERCNKYRRIFVNRGWKSRNERGYVTKHNENGLFVRKCFSSEELIFVPWTKILTLSNGSKDRAFYDFFDDKTKFSDELAYLNKETVEGTLGSLVDILGKKSIEIAKTIDKTKIGKLRYERMILQKTIDSLNFHLTRK